MAKKASKRKGPKPRRMGLILLFIPILFLLLMFIGEMMEGMFSATIHLVQVAPVILLGLLALKHPRLGGVLLAVTGFLFFISYSILSGFPLPTVILVDVILFIPMIVSGIIFIISSRPR